MPYCFRFLCFLALFPFHMAAQSLEYPVRQNIQVSGYVDAEGKILSLAQKAPLFSVMVDGVTYFSDDAKAGTGDDPAYFLNEKIRFVVGGDEAFRDGWMMTIDFLNISDDTVVIENVVPFGASDDLVHITGQGPWSLARAYLFLPGRSPVNVILPDDAWEMGYGALALTEGRSLASVARRQEIANGRKHRYETWLYPGGTVSYDLYGDEFTGGWQNGLKKMFRERWLYSLESFEDSLYRRQDLQWIRHDYVIGLQMAWDQRFYDAMKRRFTLEGFLAEGDSLFGGYDVYGLWPTWPRLGLDERNQWDLFADLPGGLEKQREIAGFLHARDQKYFICYNPWDQSTRTEDPYRGMASLIRATNADGVVLDTRGSSSYALQRAADSIKKGVVMYSEGMAVVGDMPGIVSGRVHNAIFMSPLLNLNKLIRPDFAIFRVWDVQQAPLHREAAIAFFNGYGTELNFFDPGRPSYLGEEMKFLGKTSMILRENSRNFLSYEWVPLVCQGRDSLMVNFWPGEDKDLYTILNVDPNGYEGSLIPAEKEDFHYISLWHHQEIIPDTIDDKPFLPVRAAPFPAGWSGTRKEGTLDCIAAFRDILQVEIQGYDLFYSAARGDHIKVWGGDPSYTNELLWKDKNLDGTVDLHCIFHGHEGKIVVQLMEKDGSILDERIHYLEPGAPRLISETDNTGTGDKSNKGMRFIKGGPYRFYAENPDNFIPYPHEGDTLSLVMQDFYMDIYPVTNEKYLEFIRESGYRPDDTNNYLRHWVDGVYPRHLARHPVVCISFDDANAYALWAGKRLPTEAEWQYAAQGTDGRDYPWGNEKDTSRHNHSLGFTTEVDRYPGGASPFGIMDMTGNVWQMTSDIYDNGSYFFVIIKGGSFYEPKSSWWYVKGGVRPVAWRQMWLQVSPGFDRSSTVGFRCVK